MAKKCKKAVQFKNEQFTSKCKEYLIFSAHYIIKITKFHNEFIPFNRLLGYKINCSGSYIDPLLEKELGAATGRAQFKDGDTMKCFKKTSL